MNLNVNPVDTNTPHDLNFGIINFQLANIATKATLHMEIKDSRLRSKMDGACQLPKCMTVMWMQFQDEFCRCIRHEAELQLF